MKTVIPLFAGDLPVTGLAGQTRYGWVGRHRSQ